MVRKKLSLLMLAAMVLTILPISLIACSGQNNKATVQTTYTSNTKVDSNSVQITLKAPIFERSTFGKDYHGLPTVSNNGCLTLEVWSITDGKEYQGGVAGSAKIYKWHTEQGSNLGGKKSGQTWTSTADWITEDASVWFSNYSGVKSDIVTVSVYERDDSKQDKLGTFIGSAQTEVAIGRFVALLPTSVGFGPLGEPNPDSLQAHLFKPGQEFSVTYSNPGVPHSVELISMFFPYGGQMLIKPAFNPNELLLTIKPTNSTSSYKDGTRLIIGLLQFETDGKGNVVGCVGSNETYFEVQN